MKILRIFFLFFQFSLFFFFWSLRRHPLPGDGVATGGSAEEILQGSITGSTVGGELSNCRWLFTQEDLLRPMRSNLVERPRYWRKCQ